MTPQTPSLGLFAPIHGYQESPLGLLPTVGTVRADTSQQGLWPTCPVAMVPVAQWTAMATVTKEPWLLSQA